MAPTLRARFLALRKKQRPDATTSIALFKSLHAAVKKSQEDWEAWLLLGHLIDLTEQHEERYVKVTDLLGSVSPAPKQTKFNQLTCWGKAVEHNPSCVEGLERIAQVWLLRDEPKKALDCLTRAVKLDPKSGSAHRLMGEAWLSLAEDKREGSAAERALIERAIRAYEAAYAADPKLARGWDVADTIRELYEELGDEAGVRKWSARGR